MNSWGLLCLLRMTASTSQSDAPVPLGWGIDLSILLMKSFSYFTDMPFSLLDHWDCY